ncbi:armadillo-like helical domain-containing protein 2 [Engraulis encrasicolus]|uniref:armadillo-like helical domain-containing protein 2 n=1 Tax=Engraulis encrasicolus TaxID=184585 RepID=UPI002FD6901B
MNQYLYKFNQYVGALLGTDDPQGNSQENRGKIHHDKSIREAGEKLESEHLPIKNRVRAAHDLGVLAYTGGYEGGTLTTEYIPIMLQLLSHPDVSDEHLIPLLEGLASLWHAQLANQAKACQLGASATLMDIISPECSRSDLVKRWACYALDMLCINNVPNMRVLVTMPHLQAHLEAAAALDWAWWPKNHAAVLLKVLGFWPSDTEEPVTEEGGGDQVEMEDETEREGKTEEEDGGHNTIPEED